jgi:hypothetical protein
MADGHAVYDSTSGAFIRTASVQRSAPGLFKITGSRAAADGVVRRMNAVHAGVMML